jgi:hypothetical protein
MEEQKNKEITVLQDFEVSLSGLNQLLDSPLSANTVTSTDFTKLYEQLIAVANYCENSKKALDSKIKELAKQQYYVTGDGSISNGSFRYTYIPNSKREKFDSSKFKSEHSDLYKQYVKISDVSDSIRVTPIVHKSETGGNIPTEKVVLEEDK